MNSLHIGFADELLKTAGALGFLGRRAAGVGKGLFTGKGLTALMAGGTVVGAGLAGRAAYKRGLAGGEKGRYLAASVDPVSGKALPSKAALINWHEMHGHKPSKKQLKSITGGYKEKLFR